MAQKRTRRLALNPSTWLRDSALRLCPLATRGLWVDLQCLMQLAQPRGHLVRDGRAYDVPALAKKLCIPQGEIAGHILTLYQHKLLQISQIDGLTRDGDLGIEGIAGALPADACLVAPSMIHEREGAADKPAQHARKASRVCVVPPAKPDRADAAAPTPKRAGARNEAGAEEAGETAENGVTAGLPAGAGPAVASPQIDLLGAVPEAAVDASCPEYELIDIFEKALPVLPKIRRADWPGNPARKSLADRWAEGFILGRRKSRHPDWLTYRSREEGLAAWKNFFEHVASSAFLTGKSNRWHATLAWLVKPANFRKVLDHWYFDPEFAAETPALTAFLKAYPRPSADPFPVSIAWHAAGLDEHAEAVMRALAAWKQSADWARDGGRYIPAALNWIRGRWHERAPAPSAAGALHAVPETAANNDRDWRVLRFPGGYYFLGDDTVLLDSEARDCPQVIEDYQRHGRIVETRVIPPRVAALVEAARAGTSPPNIPLHETELPAFPPESTAHGATHAIL